MAALAMQGGPARNYCSLMQGVRDVPPLQGNKQIAVQVDAIEEDLPSKLFRSATVHNKGVSGYPFFTICIVIVIVFVCFEFVVHSGYPFELLPSESQAVSSAFLDTEIALVRNVEQGMVGRVEGEHACRG